MKLFNHVSDSALVDLYWDTTRDNWAIPEHVMIAYGRAVIEHSAATILKRDLAAVIGYANSYSDNAFLDMADAVLALLKKGSEA